MDCLKDKTIRNYNYISRYNSFPYYYNTNDDKYMYGLTGQLDDGFNYSEHIVLRGDTFDSIAQKYYNRPDLFWVIADANKILDSYTQLFGVYKTLKVPIISEIKFNK